jgi:hypothetical protein
MKNRFSSQWILIGFFFAMTACVTETKAPDNTPYHPSKSCKTKEDCALAATLGSNSGPIVAQKTSVKGNEPIPGHIVIGCHIENPKTQKSRPCDLAEVKMTSDLTKESKKFSYKVERFPAPAGQDVYTIDVQTKGCDTVRTFKGVMAGMMIDAHFDPPCGTK